MKCIQFSKKYYGKLPITFFFPRQTTTAEECGSVSYAGMTGRMRHPVMGARDGNTAVPTNLCVM